MIQGTSSGAGKSIIVTALCRIFANKGLRVSPFKSQNMSSLIFNIPNSHKIIANAQAIQAIASRTEPDPRMNPILLKPIGNYQSEVYLNGEFYSIMNAQDYYNLFVLTKGFKTVLESFRTLKEKYDIIVIEGAGSPSEINIQKYDIANMVFAEKINTPVILVSDIERGGCFASILGTIMLLKPTHRKLIKGILINKFLGDNTLLSPAIEKIEKKTKKPIIGIISKIHHKIPKEDSLDSSNNNINSNNKNGDTSKRQIHGSKNNTDINDYKEKILSNNLAIESDYAGEEQGEKEREINSKLLDTEIDNLVSKIEPQINMDYILKKIM